MSLNPTSPIVGNQHLAKVRRDLEDCRRALLCDESLHLAAEALMRAMSTLTLVVEAQQDDVA